MTPSGDRGRWIGMIVLAAIAIFVFAWMQVKGRAALAEPARPAPRVEAVADLRFDATLWQWPNEPLLGFVEVPAGAFTMGSDPAIDRGAYENERWSSGAMQGSVELPAFYIARFEVTVAQFAAFLHATQRTVDARSLRAPGNHPVTHVTWTDAIAYAQWLDAEWRASSSTPAPLAALLRDGWRLAIPSEAQWEKAARGMDGRIYPWGPTPDAALANFGRSGTMPVGSFACPACSFGLADMSGNVWEMTRSPFQPYPYDQSDEARDPHADALFVMRGGGYHDTPNNARAAVRGGVDPGARSAFIGFRVVLEKT